MLEIVVAFDENKLIGKDMELPWQISEDLKHFKALTSGHRVIMGRVSYESIGRLLPNRENIILTKQVDYKVEGALIVNNISELTKLLDDSKRNFVIGGSKIYEELLPFVDILHISHIKGTYTGNVYFPNIELDKNYIKLEEKEYNDFVYCSYKKIK